MPSPPILNPVLPFVGEVDGGLTPGKMVKVQGKVPEDAVRFALNYQLGPGLNPRDDIAIHVCPRFTEGFITRNHIQSMTWGHEENFGPMVIQPGQEFEIIILCHFTCFKVAINGQHFADFRYRLPYQMVTHFVVDGDVEVSSIFFEVIPIGPPPSAPPMDVPDAAFGPPQPGGIYPTIKPDEPSGGYRPGPQPGMRQKYEEEEEGGLDMMDKIGLAVGGLAVAGGAAALASAIHKRSQQNQEGHEDHEKKSHGESQSGLDLGALGAALASSFAANAMQNSRDNYPSYPAFDPNSTSGMLGSLLGALGGGSKGGGDPSHGPQPGGNPLGALSSIFGGGSNSQGSGGGGGGGFGALSGILGGVLGGGGKNHEPSGGYAPSGGYGPPPQQQQHGSDNLLSGIGASLFSSAFDSFTKPKERPRTQPDYEPDRTQQYDHRYDPAPPAPRSAPPSEPNPPHSSGGKMSAADISRGLGLGDDDE